MNKFKADIARIVEILTTFTTGVKTAKDEIDLGFVALDVSRGLKINARKDGRTIDLLCNITHAITDYIHNN